MIRSFVCNDARPVLTTNVSQ
jgi:serine/threonine protein kinase